MRGRMLLIASGFFTVVDDQKERGGRQLTYRLLMFLSLSFQILTIFVAYTKMYVR